MIGVSAEGKGSREIVQARPGYSSIYEELITFRWMIIRQAIILLMSTGAADHTPHQRTYRPEHHSLATPLTQTSPRSLHSAAASPSHPCCGSKDLCCGGGASQICFRALSNTVLHDGHH